MIYWVHLKRSLDQATLHRDRCLEVPSSSQKTDFWEGGWFEYPDKNTALEAMENFGTGQQSPCPLCKP